MQFDPRTEMGTPGRARRRKQHFDTRTQGGPCEARQDEDGAWVVREWGDRTWTRWRRIGPDLWEREE